MVAAATAFATRIATRIMITSAAATYRLDIFGCAVAHKQNLALETNILAGKRMVEVHHDIIVGHFLHHTVDTVTVGSHHRQYGTGLYYIGVKLAIYLEYILRQGSYLLGIYRTESIVGFNAYVESLIFGKTFDGLFERYDHTGCDTEYEFFGIVHIGLVYQSLGTVGVYLIEVVAELYIFSGFNFFHIH